MKKSEVIKIIQKVIESNRYEHIPAECIAEEILSRIEKIGMLPPSIYLSNFQKNDNGWEPEND